jgi:hypothetical protein
MCLVCEKVTRVTLDLLSISLEIKSIVKELMMSYLQSPEFISKHAAHLAKSAQMQETFAVKMAEANLEAEMAEHATEILSVEAFAAKVCIGVLPDMEHDRDEQDDCKG